MIEQPTKHPAPKNKIPILHKCAGFVLCVCSTLAGLLAVLMLIAGCRWLAIEWSNDWRLSLSLALLGGSKTALAICLTLGLVSAGRFKSQQKEKRCLTLHWRGFELYCSRMARLVCDSRRSSLYSFTWCLMAEKFCFIGE